MIRFTNALRLNAANNYRDCLLAIYSCDEIIALTSHAYSSKRSDLSDCEKVFSLEIIYLVIRGVRQLCAQLPIPRLFLRQLNLKSLDLFRQLLRAERKEE